MRNSSHLFDNEIKNALHFIGQNRDASDPGKIKDLFAASTWVRKRLRQILTNERDLHRAREMLLLDLSLVEFIRLLAERFNQPDKTMLVDLAILAAENITPESEELRLCIAHLRGLPPQGASDWVAHIVSAIERLERILGAAVEWYYETFQAKAELLGKAFNAAHWTINLFTEELLRGQPPFVLSLLLKRLNQVLRKEYNLGIWQVVSPFEAVGRVVVVDTLYEVQDKAYDTQTVIVAGKVSGDEEVPSGVTAVISPDMTDIVSHVAVRARNARILFATCYDAATLDSLRAMSGRYVALTITPSGDVAFAETSAPVASDIKAADNKYVLQSAHFEFTQFALPMKAFNRRVAGGKSNNLAALRGKVPEWINLPPSVVVPFGALEGVLGRNAEIDAQYKRLLKNVAPESLTQMRALIEKLTIPNEFIAALEGVMADAGVSYTASDAPQAEQCIKRVWASLWNERAYLSRVKNFAGNPHEGISMAVLIQEIVNAEYAFVIHTVNPVTGATDEVFAEVVPGLGETLVGNHPGRALSFTCKKDGGTPAATLKVAGYPSKGLALYGEGLIFRSDSNVEDLSGFAGAGLYDSIAMRAPREVLPDYSTMPLLRDAPLRNEILSKIRDIGVVVESAFGCPQDIEGAYAHGRYYVVQSRPQVGIEASP
jgi:alpha-glucan,water dikinase